MSTDLAKREHTLPAHLTQEQKDLIATTIAPKANENELALFFNICDRTGLDPFSNQIYLVERYDATAKANVHRAQVAIDGARLVAKRAHARGGATYRPGSSYYYDAEGKESRVWLKDEPPFAARVTVIVDGHEVPGYPVNFAEMVQTKQDGSPRANWKKMPAIMLRKCAEMATLRQAFPQELSGLYLEDEGETPVTVRTEVAEELATDEQLLALADAFAKLLGGGDVEQDALDARLRERYGTDRLAELTRPQADELLERLKGEEA